jgi:hypothetical protein
MLYPPELRERKPSANLAPILPNFDRFKKNCIEAFPW